MMEKAAKQFDELCQIKDMNRRVGVACEKFSKGEISAKAIRMLYNILQSNMKIMMLNCLYERDVRKENMIRLPPHILAPEVAVIKNYDDVELYGTLIKYDLINKYDSSKTQDRFYRFRNVINQYNGNPIMKILPGKDWRFNKYRVDSFAIKGFVDELMSLRSRGNEMSIAPLGLPRSMTIGVEIELVGISYEEMEKIAEKLQSYGVDYLSGYDIKYDGTIMKNGKEGTEITSPVIQDREEDWKKLRDVCLFIQAIGATTNSSCGGHIHIGSNMLGVDKTAWEIYSKLYAEVEPLIFIISNRKGEKSRKGIERYAKKTATSIKCIDWDKVIIRNESDVRKLAKEISNNDRYKSFNLGNIANGYRPTVECRVHNSTVFYNILRENILLDGSMIQASKLCSLCYELKGEKLERIFEGNISEKEKLIRFLDFIFDSESKKEIFYKRWASKVGEELVFGKSSINTYIR